MKTLSELFSKFPLQIIAGSPIDAAINKITFDSRTVEKDDLFLAASGEYFDGLWGGANSHSSQYWKSGKFGTDA